MKNFDEMFSFAVFKGRLLDKMIDFDNYFWSETKLFLFFRHGGTSHGGTLYSIYL